MKIEDKIFMLCQSLEKGLSMPNRKKIFGIAIAKELLLLLKSSDFEMKYVIIKTLNRYKKELLLSENENVEINTLVEQSLSEIKFKKEEYLSLNALESLILSRKSIRNFSNKKIRQKDLKRAVEFANKIPAACNRQSTYFYQIQNKDIQNKLLSLQSGNQGIQAPVLGVIVSDMSLYPEKNEHLAPTFHAGMFSMNLTLMLESLGLSSCLLNWHVSNETKKKAKEILKLKSNENIESLIFIGYHEPNTLKADNQKKKSKTLFKIIN